MSIQSADIDVLEEPAREGAPAARHAWPAENAPGKDRNPPPAEAGMPRQQHTHAIRMRLLRDAHRQGLLSVTINALGVAGTVPVLIALDMTAAAPFLICEIAATLVFLSVLLAVRAGQARLAAPAEDSRPAPLQDAGRLAILVTVASLMPAGWGWLGAQAAFAGEMAIAVTLCALTACASFGSAALSATRLSTLITSRLAFALPVLVTLMIVQPPAWPLLFAANAFVHLAAFLAGYVVHLHYVRYLTQLYDVTEMRDQLETERALRSQVVHTLAHDIRQPLSAVEMTLWRTQRARDAGSAGPALEAGRKALRSAHRILDSLHELHEKHGRPPQARLDSVPLRPVFRQLTAEFAALGSRRGFVLSAEAGDLHVLADRHFLERILRNLLHNALSHAGGGAIRLEAEALEDGSEVVIRVRDEGPGVPPELRAIIFSPFVRGQSEGTASGHSGLGLAVVAELARAMDGQVRLEDTQCGASFAVTLPAAKRARRRLRA